MGANPTQVRYSIDCAFPGQVRRGAPFASYAIDRSGLRQFAQATSKHKIQSLICFCCGCVSPHASHRKKNLINWIRPVAAGDEGETFIGMDADKAEEIMGFQTFMKHYGCCDPNGPDLSEHLHEFEDWLVDVSFGARSVRLLACPEDKTCENQQPGHCSEVCSSCHIPICRKCQSAIDSEQPRMPAGALSNDMMVFYAPRDTHGTSYCDGAALRQCVPHQYDLFFSRV